MSSLSHQEQQIILRAVNSGARDYFASRRDKVAPFVEQHFCLKGALRINRNALGKDMLRAPANLLWAMPYLSIHVSSLLLRKSGAKALSDVMDKVPPGFRTKVQQEVDWLLRTELFEIPYQQSQRRYDHDQLLSSILAQAEVSRLMLGYMDKIKQLSGNKNFENKLARQLNQYTDSRLAAADLACGVITLSGGAALFKQLTPGALSTGSALAAAVAQQSAIAKFAFGSTLGSVYYGIFPASVSLGLLAASTGGVLAALGVISAFSGVITDPLQKSLGTHQRRLHKLIDALEQQFFQQSNKEFYPKDHYIARIFDLFDMLKTASMTLA
ncbi:DUF6635 family protein [Kaarinaea lacus]